MNVPQSLPLPIAGIEPWQMALMIPIIIFMIPIVAILTTHQRKMAELMQKNPQVNPQTESEMSVLRKDIARLSETVTALTLNVEDLKDEVRGGSGIQERIRTGE